MGTTVTRLKLLCISLMAMSLIFIGTGSAKVDFGDCVGMWLFDEGNGKQSKIPLEPAMTVRLKGERNGLMANLTRV